MANPEAERLAHATLGHQIAALEVIVRSNVVVAGLLEQLPALGLPFWYLGAGGVAQTVWNHLHGFAATVGIGDYDIVYFDPDDLSEAGEQAASAEVTSLAAANGVRIDVVNQARVHLWYSQCFGRQLEPYRSTEHAIATWPTTATSVGIRTGADGFTLCAPFGLADLFAMVVRPNTTLITRSVYEAKVARWQRIWPQLTILPWPAAPHPAAPARGGKEAAGSNRAGRMGHHAVSGGPEVPRQSGLVPVRFLPSEPSSANVPRAPSESERFSRGR